MKYFLHDTSAMEDEKISKLFVKFGYEGVGLFYATLEKLAKQEKPIEVNVLKFQLKVGKRLEKCWNFMEEIGIINTSNGETFNKQLLNFSEKYKIKKEKNTERISQWRKNQHFTENVTRYEHICNAPKVKESKVNESKSNIDIKGDKSPTQKSFKNFSEKEFIEEIKKYEKDFSSHMLNNFFLYWKERSAAGKMKFQLEKTWETKLRLEKWKSNDLKFSKNGNNKTPSATHGKSSGAYELAEQLREELGFN